MFTYQVDQLVTWFTCVLCMNICTVMSSQGREVFNSSVHCNFIVIFPSLSVLLMGACSCVWVCVHVHMHIHVHVYMCVHLHPTHKNLGMRLCVCVHPYMDVCVCVCVVCVYVCVYGGDDGGGGCLCLNPLVRPCVWHPQSLAQLLFLPFISKVD